MSCSFCQQEVCVCGEAYKTLSQEGMLTIMTKLKELLIAQNLSVKVSINNMDLETYLSNSGVKLEGEFLKIAIMQSDIPDEYKKAMEPYIGKPVAEFVDHWKTNEDAFIFPLLLYCYSKGIHTRIYRRIILELASQYLLGDFADIVKKDIDECSACINDEPTFLYKLHQIQSAVVGMITACETENSKKEFTRISKGLDYLFNLIGKNDAHFFENALLFMISTSADFSPLLTVWNNTHKYTSTVKEELMVADYSLSKVIINAGTFVSTSLV